MRTHCEIDGVGPSRINSMNHPGEQTWEFGGAVIVQVNPSQLKAGKIVREPMLFPCVLETAARE